MGNMGFWQLLIILVIVVLLFGTKRLKGIGSDLGGAIKGFKKAVTEEDADFKEPQNKVEEKPKAEGEAVKTESETKEKH
ncbi:twin-arginine translocase TatA/TatE family subunit [uncultured Alteromonas sp.]|jgi:sec-independent protein translocase protein TatA|uniref:twin-arginine translocase TatA/TatE family subunit n=1 Tax=uncultured Alteromonas sp. TaxID=179113 RepID=UPI0025F4EF89|nr:twin-arginine translocase TatA/TatE family subunit [uncultured Alteromonas sp.]